MPVYSPREGSSESAIELSVGKRLVLDSSQERCSMGRAIALWSMSAVRQEGDTSSVRLDRFSEQEKAFYAPGEMIEVLEIGSGDQEGLVRVQKMLKKPDPRLEVWLRLGDLEEQFLDQPKYDYRWRTDRREGRGWTPGERLDEVTSQEEGEVAMRERVPNAVRRATLEAVKANQEEGSLFDAIRGVRLWKRRRKRRE
jgi:hypothetical protein